MRKVETRIKVVTKGADVKYIPQIKGYNQSLIEWWIYLLPLLGQAILLASIWDFIRSFFWEDFQMYGNYEIDLKQGSEEYAKYVIDEFYIEYNEPKPIKHKKQIIYIKYPLL